MSRRYPVTLSALAAALVAGVTSGGLRPPLAPDHPIPPPLRQAPPTAFECRWADTPVTLDGKDDDPAWRHAQTIDAFHLPWLGKDARMGRTATKAKLL